MHNMQYTVFHLEGKRLRFFFILFNSNTMKNYSKGKQNNNDK